MILADYCSRDHQKEHWKIHKLVCKKKATDLPIDPSRPSLVTPITTEGLPDGACQFTMSMNFSGPPVYAKSKTPRNIHGDKEFIVKVQTPSKLLLNLICKHLFLNALYDLVYFFP